MINRLSLFSQLMCSVTLALIATWFLMNIMTVLHLVCFHVDGEVSAAPLLLTFPINATQGHKECLSVLFADDDTTEGLECMAVHVYGHNGVQVPRFIPVCARDDGGEE